MRLITFAVASLSALALTLVNRSPAPAAVAPVSGAPAVDFIVSLPLRNQAELETLVTNQSDPNSPLYHHFLTPAQFRARYGPAATQMNAAAAAMRAAGFTLREATSQALRFHGSVAAASAAFGVHFDLLNTPSGARPVAREAIVLPATLAASGATVIGLTDRTRMHVNSRRVAGPQNRDSLSGGYWFTDLRQAYSFPSFTTGLTGRGTTIGIVIDSAIDPSDVATYFEHEKFTTYSGGVPIPSVVIRLVGGGALPASPTDPYNPNGDGGEAALDLEMSLGSAPGATGVVYDIPDLSDGSIVAGYIDAVEDNAVDVVNSSFGECEAAEYQAAYQTNGVGRLGILRAYHSLFLQGNAQGITFVASSGDSGALQCPSAQYFARGLPGVFGQGNEFPASDPNVVAVGGTNLVTTPPPAQGTSLASQYVTENAFGDPEFPWDPYNLGAQVSGGVFASGGGPSTYYLKPHYQTLLQTPSTFRTTPDVSMQMGGCPLGAVLGGPDDTCGFAPPYYDEKPRSFVWTRYSGPFTSPNGYIALIGTSASSPEFAGLLAVKAQSLKSRLGNANELIYTLAAANGLFQNRYYHQEIPGYNGVFAILTRTLPNYSPLVGVGTPYAQNFLGVPTAPVAGDPQTPSNP